MPPVFFAMDMDMDGGGYLDGIERGRAVFVAVAGLKKETALSSYLALRLRMC